MSEADRSLLRRKPRKVHSEEEKKSYYHSWKTSGLSKCQFCQKHQLSEGTFYAWCHRYGNMAEENVSSFSPVVSAELPREEKIELLNVEMRLPNQIQIRIAFREDRLIGFLQEFCHATATVR